MTTSITSETTLAEPSTSGWAGCERRPTGEHHGQRVRAGAPQAVATCAGRRSDRRADHCRHQLGSCPSRNPEHEPSAEGQGGHRRDARPRRSRERDRVEPRTRLAEREPTQDNPSDDDPGRPRKSSRRGERVDDQGPAGAEVPRATWPTSSTSCSQPAHASAEVLALRWRDVDLDVRTVEINATGSRPRPRKGPTGSRSRPHALLP